VDARVRAVVQRVTRAEVRVEGAAVGSAGRGLLVLLGVGAGDGDDDADYLADKVVGLRVFDDGSGHMDVALGDAGGSLLVVSQFTLYGDCRKGRRPSFTAAMEPDAAERLCARFVERARAAGVHVETGRFRAHMEVDSVNDGPVTLLLDSKKAF
jgi:D-tyrosyl-tRNA(Tyr) deacylase